LGKNPIFTEKIRFLIKMLRKKSEKIRFLLKMLRKKSVFWEKFLKSPKLLKITDIPKICLSG
jgi:hypothetical protein